MTIILGDKNTASRKPTKIFKNQDLSFVFAQRNAAHCISGQKKWLEAGDYSACTPRTGPTHEVCRGAVESTTNKSAS